MTIAEMKQKAVSLIDKTENKQQLEKIILQITLIISEEFQSKERVSSRPSIEQIYQEVKVQYGNTLKNLAE